MWRDCHPHCQPSAATPALPARGHKQLHTNVIIEISTVDTQHTHTWKTFITHTPCEPRREDKNKWWKIYLQANRMAHIVGYTQPLSASLSRIQPYLCQRHEHMFALSLSLKAKSTRPSPGRLRSIIRSVCRIVASDSAVLCFPFAFPSFIIWSSLWWFRPNDRRWSCGHTNVTLPIHVVFATRSPRDVSFVPPFRMAAPIHCLVAVLLSVFRFVAVHCAAS